MKTWAEWNLTDDADRRDYNLFLKREQMAGSLQDIVAHVRDLHKYREEDFFSISEFKEVIWNMLNENGVDPWEL